MQNTVYITKNSAPETDKPTENDLQEKTAALPAQVPLQKELRFFSSPKAVKKKTQLSIFGFQIITAAAFCLLLKACHAFLPELYENISLYLQRLFR